MKNILKKISLFVTILFLAIFIFPSLILAQKVNETKEDHTAIEEAEGKLIWEKFQKKEMGCADLKDEDSAALGEYFMGLWTGANHQAMNQMMIQMMGETGEEKMHEIMGKRASGCEVNATFPGMMGMMMGSPNFLEKGGEQRMMGPGMMGWWGPGGSSAGSSWLLGSGQATWWIWNILSWATWILLIVALIAFIRWMWKKGEK